MPVASVAKEPAFSPLHVRHRVQSPPFFAGIAAIMLWGFLLDQITIHLRDRVVFWQSDKSRV